MRVKDIEFEGNEAFSSRKLRGLMQTKEEWILTPFTGAGNLNKDVLRTDVERLTAWYYDNGYVTVRIDEPKVERRDDGLVGRHQDRRGRAVQDRQGRDRRQGRCPRTQTRLPPDLATKTGEVFSASALRDDVQLLTERLSEGGFAFANIEPATESTPTRRWSTSPSRSSAAARSRSTASRSPATRRRATTSSAARCACRSRSCSPPRSCARAARRCSASASSRR